MENFTVIFSPFIVIFSRRLEIQPFEINKLGPRASLEDDRSLPFFLPSGGGPRRGATSSEDRKIRGYEGR